MLCFDIITYRIIILMFAYIFLASVLKYSHTQVYKYVLYVRLISGFYSQQYVCYEQKPIENVF